MHDMESRPRGRFAKSLALVFVGALLAACETPEPGSPEALVQEAEEKKAARVAAVEQTVEELPDWFVRVPRDGVSVYSAGTATSPDVQFAVDKAILNAKRTLADRINGLLSSKMKTFVAESGVGEETVVTTEAERVTTNLITEANVAGYSRDKSKILAQGSQYRAYVLLRYPVGAANRILMDKVKRSRVLESKLRASKAFKELEKEIKEARQRK